jgi:hypothetical protein
VTPEKEPAPGGGSGGWKKSACRRDDEPTVNDPDEIVNAMAWFNARTTTVDEARERQFDRRVRELLLGLPPRPTSLSTCGSRWTP